MNAIEDYQYETFMVIPGFPKYQVSDFGRIWNDKTGKYSNGFKRMDGYVSFDLYINGIKHAKLLHVLVANTFLENPDNKQMVDHINCNKSDNRLENLRFATGSENQQNRVLNLNNTSGVKGVNFDRKSGKWLARIQIDGIRVHLGLFNTKEEAARARIIRANQAFGVYTNACEKL